MQSELEKVPQKHIEDQMSGGEISLIASHIKYSFCFSYNLNLFIFLILHIEQLDILIPSSKNLRLNSN